MIIDFHTHIFPDKIAQKTIDLLAHSGNTQPFSDGTADGLIQRLKEACVDLAVILPVMTNPAQFESVNRFAAEINRRFANETPRLLSFAGIHPRCENLEQKMEEIAQNGFLGVKIHPDYQDTFITDEAYLQILRAAVKHDLIVVTHAGVDGAYRDRPVRCPPKLVKQLIRQVPDAKLVLAHCGGNEMFDDVLETLCGENIYFDTAYVLRYIGKETFFKLLEKHGEDRILFATDSPWSNIKEDIARLQSFHLQKSTEEKLLCENAKKLLGI